jgi:hypothetical protein
MIKSLGLFLATYALTVAITYGLAQTPVPLVPSYVGHVCDGGATFVPLDGITLCGLVAAFFSASMLRRTFARYFASPHNAGGALYHWKMLTLSMLGMLFVYAAIQTVATDCTTLLSNYEIRHISSYIVWYSVFYAAVGYLFFDLRRYRFDVMPWRAR